VCIPFPLCDFEILNLKPLKLLTSSLDGFKLGLLDSGMLIFYGSICSWKVESNWKSLFTVNTFRCASLCIIWYVGQWCPLLNSLPCTRFLWKRCKKLLSSILVSRRLNEIAIGSFPLSSFLNMDHLSCLYLYCFTRVEIRWNCNNHHHWPIH
jgi:hypothetical protein